MELPVIYIFTHDSIGLGQDGPTHQPVEQLIALRSIPGLITLRPADANEVVEAWRVIIGLKHQPACLVLSRQPLPTFDRTRYASAAGVARGAYVMADAENGKPAVILIGTGSEVALCVEVYETLKQDGIPARVVSMPSWELFEQQDQAYRDSVLPPDITARVSVEAGSVIGWDRYVGVAGARIGMHTFGSSAPIKDLLTKFGFTPEKVLAAAKEQIAKLAKETDGMNPLKQLEACGQSPWLDYLKRSLIEKGELRTLIERDGLKGVTSNPSIFEKAIGESDEYADALKQFQAAGRPQHLRNLRASGDRRYPWRRRRAAPGLRGDARPGRLYQPGMLALSGQRYRSHGGRSAAAVGGGGASQPDGEGAGDPGRHSGDPRTDRSRTEHQHHLAVFRERLRAGGRSLYLRARGSGAGRRRRLQDRQRRQHLRQPHRYCDRQAAGQAR